MDKYDLKRAVENYKTTAPMLIVGEASTLFLKAWKYPIKYVETKGDVRALVDYYSMVTPKIPLVISDLSLLNDSGINLLLKLVEESKYPIILLASFDNINPILFSRIKTFIKFSEDINSKFYDSSKGSELLEESGLENKFDKIKYIRDNSPILYSVPSNPKIASILYGGDKK